MKTAAQENERVATLRSQLQRTSVDRDEWMQEATFLRGRIEVMEGRLHGAEEALKEVRAATMDEEDAVEAAAKASVIAHGALALLRPVEGRR